MSEASAQGGRWERAQEGAERMREGDLEGAVEELEGVIRSDPDNEYAHFFLGNVWFERQGWDRCLAAHVRALEISPRYVGAMLGAGHALRMMGRTDQAIRMANQVLALQKDDPDALHLLGLLHFQRGDRDRARQVLERFLRTRPEIEVAMEVEGMLQVLRGEVLPLPARDEP